MPEDPSSPHVQTTKCAPYPDEDDENDLREVEKAKALQVFPTRVPSNSIVGFVVKGVGHRTMPQRVNPGTRSIAKGGEIKRNLRIESTGRSSQAAANTRVNRRNK